jgi:hypothetical protein
MAKKQKLDTRAHEARIAAQKSKRRTKATEPEPEQPLKLGKASRITLLNPATKLPHTTNHRPG